MKLEPAIDMGPAKERLRHLRDYMPDADNVLCDLAAYLADRIHRQVVPTGFALGAVLAISDLEIGVNSITQEPIRNSLVGYPSGMYRLMVNALPQIADAVFPEEFARGVREVYDAVDAIKRGE